MTLQRTESLAPTPPSPLTLWEPMRSQEPPDALTLALESLPQLRERLPDLLNLELLESPGRFVLLLNKLIQLNLESDPLLASLAFGFPDALQLPSDDPSCATAMGLLQRLQHLNLPNRPRNEQQAQLMMRMIMALVNEQQLLAGLLAIQLERLEQHSCARKDDSEDVAWTSLHVFAPLAARLGIFWIKAELEDLAFRLLAPNTYQELKKLVASKRDERARKVEELTKSLQNLLEPCGLTPEIQGRYKRFYSIHEKLRKVNHDFERIQDLIGFRLLLSNVDECYAALGYIHEQWPPRKDRIKDYIAQPKPNGYQSLHTTIELPDGESVEVQIRTYEMHFLAEFGIAAHWRYKEQLRRDSNAQDSQPPEPPQVGFFPDSLFTVTPNGDIIELPNKATALDFAYAVHTEVGSRTTGVKINDVIAKLDSPLQTGDRVTVLTSAKQVPNKEWLGFAATHRARSKIRHALREQQREQFRKQGWERLEQEFRASGLNLNRMVKESRLEQECLQHRNQTFEHVLFCLGENSIRASTVLGWFVSSQEATVLEELVPETKPQAPRIETGKTVLVDGLEQVPIRIARCCTPTASDPIQGYLAEGGLVSVHHPDCEALHHLNPDRQVPVHWG